MTNKLLQVLTGILKDISVWGHTRTFISSWRKSCHLLCVENCNRRVHIHKRNVSCAFEMATTDRIPSQHTHILYKCMEFPGGLGVQYFGFWTFYYFWGRDWLNFLFPDTDSQKPRRTGCHLLSFLTRNWEPAQSGSETEVITASTVTTRLSFLDPHA